MVSCFFFSLNNLTSVHNYGTSILHYQTPVSSVGTYQLLSNHTFLFAKLSDTVEDILDSKASFQFTSYSCGFSRTSSQPASNLFNQQLPLWLPLHKLYMPRIISWCWVHLAKNSLHSYY